MRLPVPLAACPETNLGNLSDCKTECFSTGEYLDGRARNLNSLASTEDLQYYQDIADNLAVTTDITDREIVSKVMGRQIVINENVANSDEDEEDKTEEDLTVPALTETLRAGDVIRNYCNFNDISEDDFFIQL
ncbi:hypothetical protein FQA39_LY02203 [Lamprigera yunnana]|nr:hypothetical protein FQA39_LY02203 [Lamprigera yunnana]